MGENHSHTQGNEGGHPHSHHHGPPHGHVHGHHHHHHGSAAANIGFAFLLNFAFVIIEFVGAILTGSVAILADAMHDLGDCISLGMAWGLEKLSGKKRTQEFSYGFGRLSLLGALFSGLVILVGSIVVLATAIPRFFEPNEPHSTGMIALAVIGVAVNGWAALRLSIGRTMNEKVLLWHYIEDVLGWVAVLVGSILIWWRGWNWIDPLLAVAIAFFVGYNVIRNLKSTLKLFLQSVPEGFEEHKFRAALLGVSGVGAVHDLHIWSIDGNRHILSLHVELGAGSGNAAEIKKQIRTVAAGFGDFHTTIEIETAQEPCEDKC